MDYPVFWYKIRIGSNKYNFEAITCDDEEVHYAGYMTYDGYNMGVNLNMGINKW